MKPLVYLASPYTKGDQALNSEFQLRMFNEIMDEEYCLLYPPLWTHFYHTCYPRKEGDWLELDFRVIEKCDALLRLPATNEKFDYYQWDSSGADKEVALARSLSIPVFLSIEDLKSWAINEFPLVKKSPKD